MGKRKVGPTSLYFRAQDLPHFKAAAARYKSYVAVRRINPKSFRHAGKDKFTPKMIDCKAKTAEEDIIFNGKMRNIAGLVVNCDVYKGRLLEIFGSDKLRDAEKSWGKFKGPKLAPLSIYGPDGKVVFPGSNHGYTYFTEMDPNSEFYGCIRWALSGQWGDARYVHGDYDLYAVVSFENPSENIFVEETRLGEKHTRTPQQMDVQNYLTTHMRGMVCHGEQDTYKTDLDDDLDVFCPDGSVIIRNGEAEIRQLYAVTFKGRKMAHEGMTTVPAGGLWRKIV